MFPPVMLCTSDKEEQDMSLTCVSSVDEGNTQVSCQSKFVSGLLCDRQEDSVREELLVAQGDPSHEPSNSTSVSGWAAEGGVSSLHSLIMSQTEDQCSTKEVTAFGTCSVEYSQESVRSPEILRGEAQPVSAVTSFVPTVEPRCQRGKAPSVDILEHLVENRHDQEEQVPGQVRQVMSSTVMVGQGEDEIVKEDISIIQVRQSIDPRVSKEPTLQKYGETETSEEQMGPLAGFTSDVPEEGEPDALRKFILDQLGTMSPPHPPVTSFIRIGQSQPRRTMSNSVHMGSRLDKGTTCSKKWITEPRVVPELKLYTDKEIYRGRPVSERLFDEFLENEARGNLKMRKIVPLRKKLKKATKVVEVRGDEEQ